MIGWIFPMNIYPPPLSKSGKSFSMANESLWVSFARVLMPPPSNLEMQTKPLKIKHFTWIVTHFVFILLSVWTSIVMCARDPCSCLFVCVCVLLFLNFFSPSVLCGSVLESPKWPHFLSWYQSVSGVWSVCVCVCGCVWQDIFICFSSAHLSWPLLPLFLFVLLPWVWVCVCYSSSVSDYFLGWVSHIICVWPCSPCRVLLEVCALAGWLSQFPYSMKAIWNNVPLFVDLNFNILLIIDVIFVPNRGSQPCTIGSYW